MYYVSICVLKPLWGIPFYVYMHFRQATRVTGDICVNCKNVLVLVLVLRVSALALVLVLRVNALVLVLVLRLSALVLVSVLGVGVLALALVLRFGVLVTSLISINIRVICTVKINCNAAFSVMCYP